MRYGRSITSRVKSLRNRCIYGRMRSVLPFSGLSPSSFQVIVQGTCTRRPRGDGRDVWSVCALLTRGCSNQGAQTIDYTAWQSIHIPPDSL